MRHVLVSIVVALVALPAAANMVVNGEFDVVIDGQLPGWSSSGDGTHPVTDTVTNENMVSLGWWWYDTLYQDTGATFAADTVYTLEVRARDGDGNAQLNDPSVGIGIILFSGQ